MSSLSLSVKLKCEWVTENAPILLQQKYQKYNFFGGDMA